MPGSATPSPDFGALLRRARQAAGLTQEELAERARISVRSVGDIERGISRAPRKDTVALLAEALRLDGAARTTFEESARRSGAHVPTMPIAYDTGPTPGIGLVGRAVELTLLERHIAGEGPPVLLLAGEPGIGKSRLLREAAALAHGCGWSVLAVARQRGGSREPYAPLPQALRSHLQSPGLAPAAMQASLQGCAWLVRLLPELAAEQIEPLPPWTLSPAQERRLMIEAVARFLSNVAGPAGTWLLLDDVQWAEPDAPDLLLLLLRSVTAAPLRVVGA